jgi:hypothetical protein
MAKSQFNFAAADKAAHAKNGFCTVHKDGGITFHGDPLATCLANRPSQSMEHGSGGPTVWLDPEDVVDDWARVLQMRKDGHPLILGGNYRDPYDFIVRPKHQGQGATSRRTKPGYKPNQPSVWR